MRWFLAAVAMLALAGCGQAAMVAPPPTPVPTVAPTAMPVPPTQTPYVIVVTATPVPSPQPAPYPTTFAPATPAQTQAMLSALDQVAAACGWTPDVTANAVLGDEQYLAKQGVTTWGSAPQVTAFLNDVLYQVRTDDLLCPYAFGDAVLDVEVQEGILTRNGASLLPAHPTPVIVPPTPTIVDAPAQTLPQPSAAARVPPAPTTSPTPAPTEGKSNSGSVARPAGPTVSVIACPTTFGAPGESVPPSPVAVRVAAPLPAGATLAYYAGDAFGVLAPAGWACRAAVGADGSQSVSAYPVESPSASTNVGAGDGGPAVTAGNIPACSGCILVLACPFFTQAAQAQAKDFGQFGIACSRAHVTGEVVTHLSATAVAFEDPPGVHGAGQPSGGSLPANGVVLYTPGSPAGAPGSRSYAAARDATCTLPESQHAVCTAILNDFLQRFPVGK